MPPKLKATGATNNAQDRLEWVPSHKLQDPGPADYSPAKPRHRPPEPFFTTSTREECERAYPGWGIPPVASAISITPGPASYELPRPEQKDIPAAVFGKPVVAKRRRRKLGAVGSSSRGDPEVRAARVPINRVPTPGPGAYEPNPSALCPSRCTTLKGRSDLHRLYLGRGFDTGPSPAMESSLTEEVGEAPHCSEKLDAFSSIDNQRGWSFGTGKRAVSEPIIPEDQQHRRQRAASPNQAQRPVSPASPSSAGHGRRAAPSRQTDLAPPEAGRPATAPSWLDSFVSGNGIGSTASVSLLSYLRRMQSYTSTTTFNTSSRRLHTAAGSRDQRQFLQTLARLKRSHERCPVPRRARGGPSKPRPRDFRRSPSFSFARGGRFLDCLLERHDPDSCHKPQAPPCTRYSPAPGYHALHAITRPISFGGAGSYRGDPDVFAQIKEDVPGPGTYRLTLAERADHKNKVSATPLEEECSWSTNQGSGPVVSFQDSDDSFSTRRLNFNSRSTSSGGSPGGGGGGGKRPTLRQGLSCRFGEVATLRSAPRPAMERQARDRAADKLFISTHFLDNKRGAESPGPSAVLDHGKLTPWIRKHPIQFGTQRRGLTLAEVEATQHFPAAAATTTGGPTKPRRTSFLARDVVERAERLTRPSAPKRSFSRGPRKLMMTV